MEPTLEELKKHSILFHRIEHGLYEKKSLSDFTDSSFSLLDCGLVSQEDVDQYIEEHGEAIVSHG